jgi:hypothetical protein
VSYVPSWWAVVLLALGAFRITRLIGWDDLTIQARRYVTGVGDEEHKQWAYVIDHQREVDEDPWDIERVHWLDDAQGELADRLEAATGKRTCPPIVAAATTAYPPISPRRYYLSKMVRCPWCAGWWVTLIVWALWLAWPHAVLIAVTPFALSAILGLIAKNLDP